MFVMKATRVGGRRRCGLGVKASIGNVMVVCWAEGMGGGVRSFAVGGMMERKRRRREEKVCWREKEGRKEEKKKKEGRWWSGSGLGCRKK